jgi:hypothetical protein
MSKKKPGGSKPPVAWPRPQRLSKVSVAVAALVLCVAVAGAASGWWSPIRRSLGLSTPVEPARQQGELPLSKEYVRVGGVLVATEEPQPAGPAPTGLSASAASNANLPVSIDLNWSAPASGTVSHYIVERRQLLGGELTTLAGNVPPASNGYHDSNVVPDTAYLYYVRAVFSGGSVSIQSEPDLATTVLFTDGNPLQAGVLIRARHLVELRRAVNAVRALAGGLGPAAYTYPDPVSNPPEQRQIYLKDITELRARLDEALGVLGLQRPYPSEPALAVGAEVSAAHFEQLRERMR